MSVSEFPQSGPARMIDPFGRHVTYLRVSLTNRCQLDCAYCTLQDEPAEVPSLTQRALSSLHLNSVLPPAPVLPHRLMMRFLNYSD